MDIFIAIVAHPLYFPDALSQGSEAADDEGKALQCTETWLYAFVIG